LAICILPNKIGDLPSSLQGWRPAFFLTGLATYLLPNKVGDLPLSWQGWRPALFLRRLATCLFPGKDGEDAIGPLHLYAVGSVRPAVQQNLQKARKLIAFSSVNFKK
jgi:hypothetical protein